MSFSNVYQEKLQRLMASLELSDQSNHGLRLAAAEWNAASRDLVSAVNRTVDATSQKHIEQMERGLDKIQPEIFLQKSPSESYKVIIDFMHALTENYLALKSEVLLVYEASQVDVDTLLDKVQRSRDAEKQGRTITAFRSTPDVKMHPSAPQTPSKKLDQNPFVLPPGDAYPSPPDSTNGQDPKRAKGAKKSTAGKEVKLGKVAAALGVGRETKNETEMSK